MRKWAIVAAVAGTATLAVAIALSFVPGDKSVMKAPPNEHGFKQVMIWFELSDSAAEVFANLGMPDQQPGIERRRILDAQNKLDLLLLVGYSTFNAALFLLLRRLNGPGMRWGGAVLALGLVLAFLMGVGDLVENIQLFKLTGYAAASDVPDGVITLLKVSTRVKWGAIFVAALLLAWNYLVYFGRRPGVLLCLLYLATAVPGLIGILYFPARFIVGPAINPLVLAWFGSLIHAALLLRKVPTGASADSS